MNSSSIPATPADALVASSMDTSLPEQQQHSSLPRRYKSKTTLNPLYSAMLLSTDCNQVQATMTQCISQHSRSSSIDTNVSFVCQAAEKYMHKCQSQS